MATTRIGARAGAAQCLAKRGLTLKASSKVESKSSVPYKKKKDRFAGH